MALNRLRLPRSESKAIDDPFGDQAASPLTPFQSGSLFTPDPSGVIMKRFVECFGVRRARPLWRSLWNASRLPFGDHTAQPPAVRPWVSFRGPERSEFA